MLRSGAAFVTHCARCLFFADPGDGLLRRCRDAGFARRARIFSPRPLPRARGAHLADLPPECQSVASYLKAVVRDIEGCFCNMPKEAIRLGLRSELHKLEAKFGYDGITVPKRAKKIPCTFKKSTKKGMVRIPFEDLMDIMEFALDNTVMRDFDGQLWRQRSGIPMGDAHSPGMCNIACAWMEDEWLQTVHPDSREHFTARRYMDDLLIFYARSSGWDEERFLRDLCGECYLPPLKLEDGGEGTFLETSFRITETNQIQHWLKNVNVAGAAPVTWRYAHYDSHTNFDQKRAVMMACLRKVHNMASDSAVLRTSAIQKVAEFARLRYPRKLLWTACTTMAVNTQDPALRNSWFRAREQIPYAQA